MPVMNVAAMRSSFDMAILNSENELDLCSKSVLDFIASSAAVPTCSSSDFAIRSNRVLGILHVSVLSS